MGRHQRRQAISRLIAAAEPFTVAAMERDEVLTEYQKTVLLDEQIELRFAIEQARSFAARSDG